MGGDRDDRDARLAERHLSRAMDDREPLHAEPLGDLVRDLAEDPQRHRLVGLVPEGLDRPAGVSGGLGLLPRRRRAGRDPGPAEEPDDRPVLVGREPVLEIGQDRPGDRRLRDLEDPRGRSTAAGSSAAPPLTGGMNATSSPSSSAVAGSA